MLPPAEAARVLLGAVRALGGPGSGRYPKGSGKQTLEQNPPNVGPRIGLIAPDGTEHVGRSTGGLGNYAEDHVNIARRMINDPTTTNALTKVLREGFIRYRVSNDEISLNYRAGDPKAAARALEFLKNNYEHGNRIYLDIEGAHIPGTVTIGHFYDEIGKANRAIYQAGQIPVKTLGGPGSGRYPKGSGQNPQGAPDYTLDPYTLDPYTRVKVQSLGDKGGDEHLRFVVYYDHEEMGSADVHDSGDDSLFISMIHVNQEAQGSGFGKAMLYQIIDTANQRGKTKLIGESSSESYRRMADKILGPPKIYGDQDYLKNETESVEVVHTIPPSLRGFRLRTAGGPGSGRYPKGSGANPQSGFERLRVEGAKMLAKSRADITRANANPRDLMDGDAPLFKQWGVSNVDEYLKATETRLKGMMKDAHVFIRMNTGDLDKVLASDEILNAFDSGTSHAGTTARGDIDFARRQHVEDVLFDIPQDALGSARPKYGYLSSGDGISELDPGTLRGAGKVAIKLHPHVKSETTFTVGDSADQAVTLIPEGLGGGWHTRVNFVPQPMTHPTAIAAPRGVLYGKTRGARGQHQVEKLAIDAGYVEAQIHTRLRVSDIASVTFEGAPRSSLLKNLKSKGIAVKVVKPRKVRSFRYNEGITDLGGPGSGRYPKGSGKQNPQSGVQGFMEEFESLGYASPFNPRELVIDNEAIVELWARSPEEIAAGWRPGIHLSSIRAVEPRTGAGTRTMKKLIQLADKHGVELEGTAKPFATHSKQTLNKAQLLKWYVGLGFKQQPYIMQPEKLSDAIVYTPKSLKTLGGPGSGRYPKGSGGHDPLHFTELEEAWAGGVGDLGSSEAGNIIQLAKGYSTYRERVQAEIRAKHGDSFTVYRAMTPEKLAEWKNGDVTEPVGFTTRRELAENWGKLAMNRGKNFIVVRTIAKPEFVVMRGKAEESEIVIDANEISWHQLEILALKTLGGPGSGRYPKGSGQNLSSKERALVEKWVQDSPEELRDPTTAEGKQFTAVLNKLPEVRGTFYRGMRVSRATLDKLYSGELVLDKHAGVSSSKDTGMFFTHHDAPRDKANPYSVLLVFKGASARSLEAFEEKDSPEKEHMLLAGTRYQMVDRGGIDNTSIRMIVYRPVKLKTLGGPGSGRYPKGSGGHGKIPLDSGQELVLRPGTFDIHDALASGDAYARATSGEKRAPAGSRIFAYSPKRNDIVLGSGDSTATNTHAEMLSNFGRSGADYDSHVRGYLFAPSSELPDGHIVATLIPGADPAEYFDNVYQMAKAFAQSGANRNTLLTAHGTKSWGAVIGRRLGDEFPELFLRGAGGPGSGRYPKGSGQNPQSNGPATQALITKLGTTDDWKRTAFIAPDGTRLLNRGGHHHQMAGGEAQFEAVLREGLIRNVPEGGVSLATVPTREQARVILDDWIAHSENYLRDYPFAFPPTHWMDVIDLRPGIAPKYHKFDDRTTVDGIRNFVIGALTELRGAGGPGSGHFGHAGRPGKEGGSSKSSDGLDNADEYALSQMNKELRSSFRKLGIREVDLSNTVMGVRAALVAEKTLTEMKKRGYRMPKSLVIEKTEYVVAWGATSEGGDRLKIRLPQSAPLNTPVDRLVEVSFKGESRLETEKFGVMRSPNFAVRTMEDLIVHEMGHVQRWDVPTNRNFHLDVAFKVSKYASSSPDEFIAETFVRLYRGDKLPKDVLDMYTRHRGPAILPPRRSR